ncbi:MAG: hypothetical protein VYE73_09780 [Acidobacteriota bacterium]|nr:hypothetical protein [Acidobacteriota bacterium]
MAAAFALTRFLKVLLYDVAPTDPATWVTVVAIFLSIAVVASLVPARRAAATDPIQVLGQG